MVQRLHLGSKVRTDRGGPREGSMLLQFLFSMLLNHLRMSMDISLEMVQRNAVILAVGLFVFIAVRLNVAARERQRRLAAALLIW